jgi:hypothetical protein
MKKGYKAYKKGLVCRGKHYKTGEVFTEDKAEVCNSGMHYCENPLDCLEHYTLLDDNNELIEMTEIEDLDSENRKTDDNKKYCTKKLKIKSKLSLEQLIEKSFESICKKLKIKNSKYCSQQVTEDDFSYLSSSTSYTQMVSVASYSQLAAAGDYTILANTGNYTQVSTSGDYSQLCNTGYSSRLINAGNYSQIANTGNCSQIASTGIGSKINSGGYNSRIVSSANYSYAAGIGKKNIVVNVGIGSLAKASRGSWIVLAEFNQFNEVTCVKTTKVDGVEIKENTYYRLVNGEFKEF